MQRKSLAAESQWQLKFSSLALGASQGPALGAGSEHCAALLTCGRPLRRSTSRRFTTGPGAPADGGVWHEHADADLGLRFWLAVAPAA